MAYGSYMVVYILRTASLDRSRANQGEGCGGGGQVGERANGWCYLFVIVPVFDFPIFRYNVFIFLKSLSCDRKGNDFCFSAVCINMALRISLGLLSGLVFHARNCRG
jgi:hypothetical protein